MALRFDFDGAAGIGDQFGDHTPSSTCAAGTRCLQVPVIGGYDAGAYGRGFTLPNIAVWRTVGRVRST